MVTTFSYLKSIILTPTSWQSPAHVEGEQAAESRKIILLAKTKRNKKTKQPGCPSESTPATARPLANCASSRTTRDARPPGAEQESHRACSSGPQFRQGMYF